MKPAPFDYAAPERLDEALSLLDEYGDDGKVLAGGQSLVPMLALRVARFDQLIDIGRIAELQGVARRRDSLVLGAATRQAAVATDSLVRRHAPLLAKATHYIGHFQIRNRGTIGGSLAHADPAAEYPAVAVALDAEAEIATWRSRRRVPVGELIESAYVTTIAPDELLVAVHVPISAQRTGGAVREIARRPGDFALAGAVAVVSIDENEIVTHVRVVVFAVEQRPVRLLEVEQALLGRRDPQSDFEALAARAAADLDCSSDVHATDVYRRRVVGTLAVAVVHDALADARRREHHTEPQ